MSINYIDNICTTMGLHQAAKGTNNHHALSISKMLAQYHITHGSSAIIHHDLLELLLSNPDDNVHINATNALVAIPDKSQIKNEIEFLFNDENRMRRNNAFLALQGEMDLAPYSDKIIDACASDMPHNAYILLTYTTGHSGSLDTIFDARVLEDLGGSCPIKRGYAQAIISKIKDPSRFVAPLHELVANCAINTPGAISALSTMAMWKGDPIELLPALEIGVTARLNEIVRTALKVIQFQRNPCHDFRNGAQRSISAGLQHPDPDIVILALNVATLGVAENGIFILGPDLDALKNHPSASVRQRSRDATEMIKNNSAFFQR